MNYKTVIKHVGKVVGLEALLFLFPILVGIIYKENVLPFILSAIIAGTLYLISVLISRNSNLSIYSKDGFAIVTFAWIFMALIGAIPFVLGGAIPSYVDAVFETVSGFTTTGATIIQNVEVIDKCMLFWRSFTHWLGGMGVLVFILAIGEKTPEKSMNILRAEMAGPGVDKIMPKSRSTARVLYFIYLGMTIVMFIFLLFGKMPVFDSIINALGTAGTGGFGIRADSIASYSAYSQCVIAIFMVLFGVNFNLYFLLIVGKAKAILKSNELKCYFGIILVTTAIITYNTRSLFPTIGETIRQSFFQVSSIITTTGFATCDFNNWPVLSKSLLVLLMIIGGCAGSTAGGLKVSRVVVLFQNVKTDMRKVLQNHSVHRVKLNGKKLEPEEATAISEYFVIYIIATIAVFLLISFEPFGIESNLTSTISCINNIGPALGEAGPSSTYAAYSDWSKVVLTMAMLLGRLEIYPIFITFLGKRN